MSNRDKLLRRLADGLHQGFALNWQNDGISHGWPGHSLWARAMRLKTQWRRARIPAGARIVVSLPNSPAYIAYMLATWMGGWVFCPLPALHTSEQSRRIALLKPALWIREQNGRITEELGAGTMEQDPEAAMIIWSSASIGPGSAYLLSFAALLWQIDAHLSALHLQRESFLWNTLPWAHCFAGILELLPACVTGSVIHVDAQLSRRPPQGCTHLLTVPRIAALLEPERLQQLEGGIVGGAPIGAKLAKHLSGSRLCAGYGQSEAGPGITLGDPGHFEPYILGRALVECKLHQGALHYRSSGQAAARLDAGGWQNIAASDGWIDSGDEVRITEDGIFYWRGRRDGRFSLADGRSIRPENEETRLLEQYPEADAIILGAPGWHHLTALARVPHDLQKQLQRRWQEPYHLTMPSDQFWKEAPIPHGKPNRRWVYEHWQNVV
ncbi:MAG: AMP-binding protein [Acidithiobacillus sp.]